MGFSRFIWKILEDCCPDKMYLSLLFKKRLGYKMDWKNPQTFNQKLQWMKLYYHNPKMTEYADKYAVRKHIEELFGEKYLIELLGVYDKADEIDFEALPNQFVLKCNHGAGFNIICKDKSEFDIEGAKKKLDKWMKTDFYKIKREYHYKDIPKKIICERFMKDAETEELNDYKFFCIGGEVRMIQVDFDRYANHKRNIYDKNWNLLDVQISFPNDKNRKCDKPEDLEKMIEIAEKLSKEFPQVRVDLFYINHNIYIGEMTFFSGAGFSKYNPAAFERELGSLLKLPMAE